MKHITYLCSAAILLAIAAGVITFAPRLSEEFIMTIIGVSCGIAASIPVSVGLLLALRQAATPREYQIEPVDPNITYNTVNVFVQNPTDATRGQSEWKIVDPPALLPPNERVLH